MKWRVGVCLARKWEKILIRWNDDLITIEVAEEREWFTYILIKEWEFESLKKKKEEEETNWLKG